MATAPACCISRLGSFRRSDACCGDVHPRVTVPATPTLRRYCIVFAGGIYLIVEELAIRVSRSVRALTKRRSRARARQGRARADMIPPTCPGTGREHVQCSSSPCLTQSDRPCAEQFREVSSVSTQLPVAGIVCSLSDV